MPDKEQTMISETATKKPWYKEIDLDKLRIDGGTQQRPEDPAVIDEYADRMQDGSDPPGVRAIYDGDNYWLWDGFQRRAAAKKAGRSAIGCYITRGTQRDAQWLSFAANKDHGLRRPPGAVRAIVEKILKDPAWKKATLPEIAEHVGTSRRYVQMVKADLAAIESGQKNTARVPQAAAPPPIRETPSEQFAPHSANGEPEEEAEDPPLQSPPAEPQDMLGNPLVRPEHREVFARRFEIEALMRAISSTRTEALKAAREGDPLYLFLVTAEFDANAGNAYGDLKFALPYALCPAHPDDVIARQGCRWCNGRGWVTERRHKLATESRAAAQAMKEEANR
jgi:hypothetical protein